MAYTWRVLFYLYYYYYYYCALFQVLFVILIWFLTARNSVCCLGSTGMLWPAPDSGSKFMPPRINFTPEDNLTCLLNHLVFSKFTYSEWLIMRFPARPEISLFIAKAMPALAHTQFSFQLELTPAEKTIRTLVLLPICLYLLPSFKMHSQCSLPFVFMTLRLITHWSNFAAKACHRWTKVSLYCS